VASVARYQALLGDGATVSQPAVIAGLGIRVAVVRFGEAQITLITPASDSGPAGLALREHLAMRGEGPYAVAFATALGVARFAMPATQAAR
jgi:hypothetical protein